MISREEAFEFLKEHVKSDSLIKHSLAVEGAMKGYAKKFDKDVERWSVCGLLHDIDFEKYPDEHPLKGVDILREKGFDKDFVSAVKGHADFTNTPRETLMAKVLYAVDELSSFTIAAVLVRPQRFGGLKVKSIKKKLKSKSFAQAVNRETIKNGAKELGVELNEHIQTVIDALTEHEKDLNKEGLSLIE
ncbi:MAG: HDIG domain-containing protein [Firmicutes bacterium]|nr:HDIG domain-containing protein [Bacillota bacterium]